MLRRRLTLLLIVMLFAVGCSPAKAPAALPPQDATVPAAPATSAPPTLAPIQATGAPAPTSATAAATVAQPATVTPDSTEAATALPRITRAIPTGLPAGQAEKLSSLQRSYVTMVLLESSMAMLDDIAAQMQAKTIDEVQGQGYLLGIGAILSALEEMVGQPAPDANLTDVWASAQEAHSAAQQVLTDWSQAKLVPAEVPERLKGPRQTLDGALKQAEQAMAQYNVTPEQLKQWREETVAQLAGFRMQMGATPPKS